MHVISWTRCDRVCKQCIKENCTAIHTLHIHDPMIRCPLQSPTNDTLGSPETMCWKSNFSSWEQGVRMGTAEDFPSPTEKK
jgi:hypothetical protein